MRRFRLLSTIQYCAKHLKEVSGVPVLVTYKHASELASPIAEVGSKRNQLTHQLAVLLNVDGVENYQEQVLNLLLFRQVTPHLFMHRGVLKQSKDGQDSLVRQSIGLSIQVASGQEVDKAFIQFLTLEVFSELLVFRKQLLEYHDGAVIEL